MGDTLTFEAALTRLEPEPGLVVLMCGVVGSGKTTFSQALERRSFLRLSIDEEVWDVSGRYGVDYPAEQYDLHLTAARERMKQKLILSIEAGRAVVLDSAFWNRAARDDYRDLITMRGGQHRLVYMRADGEVLRQRLAERSGRFDANAAFAVSDEILTRYLTSFEPPEGEGELIVSN